MATAQETSNVDCAQERMSSANWVPSTSACERGKPSEGSFFGRQKADYTIQHDPIQPFSQAHVFGLIDAGTSPRVSHLFQLADGRSTEDLASMLGAAFERVPGRICKSSEVTSLSGDVPSCSSKPRNAHAFILVLLLGQSI